jgi:16S rRNA (guanine(1405)-N(7))-methyltransferase
MGKKSSTLTPEMIDDLVNRISISRKYHHLGIPAATIRDLIAQALSRGTHPSDIEKTVKEKLHNLVAPYLGDPAYPSLASELTSLPHEVDSPELQAWCLQVMRAHSSTRERIPILDEFYRTIFEVTGEPRSILDLACGLNPFSIPWMQLNRDVGYFAFDLHQPRVLLIDAFLKHIGQDGAGIHSDILVQPPRQKADIAFFFKEAHRFEQRQHGVNRAFFRSIPARFLLVSLPTANLTGRRSMLEQDRILIDQSISGLDWKVQEILFENEIVFCIEKDNET